MHGHPCRLVHHQEVFILIEDLEGNGFGQGFERGSRNDFDFDGLARRDTMGAPRCASADAHPPLVNQLLDARAAELGQALGKEEVQSPPCIFGGNDEAFERWCLGWAHGAQRTDPVCPSFWFRSASGARKKNPSAVARPRQPEQSGATLSPAPLLGRAAATM